MDNSPNPHYDTVDYYSSKYGKKHDNTTYNSHNDDKSRLAKQDNMTIEDKLNLLELLRDSPTRKDLRASGPYENDEIEQNIHDLENAVKNSQTKPARPSSLKTRKSTKQFLSQLSADSDKSTNSRDVTSPVRDDRGEGDWSDGRSSNLTSSLGKAYIKVTRCLTVYVYRNNTLFFSFFCPSSNHN